MRQRGAEAWIRGEIEDRSECPRPVVVGAPDDELEASLPAGSRAHRAGFEGDVEDAIVEAPIAGRASGGTEGDQLGMAGGVGIVLAAVSGPRDDLSTSGDDCPYRDLTAPCGGLCLGHGLRHEAPVVVVEDPIGHHLWRITKGPRFGALLR